MSLPDLSHGVDYLPDEELERLNGLLPWAAYVHDGMGRRFGAAYSESKRNEAMKVPDRRILELDDRMRLRDLTVLEIGCFEGIHTAALCHLAKRVLACDSRIENVVKTIVRCALFNAHPTVFRWNVEERPLDWFPIDADVLHHVGVLYHLTDPVGHLRILLPRIRKGLLIDTQLAPEDTTYDTYLSAGRPYRYVRYREAGREAPFAGMEDHAKWLLKQDLLDIVSEHGFTKIDVARLETERNGPRITLYAER